ncbi:hypothetical protein VNO77_03777 [Canavalia gladiata]|uniref:Uncharacterized protein n=1 Tax=Canavalia gladiata TaxID=3824 RepID=A0AAN9N0H2_CANGL
MVPSFSDHKMYRDEENFLPWELALSLLLEIHSSSTSDSQDQIINDGVNRSQSIDHALPIRISWQAENACEDSMESTVLSLSAESKGVKRNPLKRKKRLRLLLSDWGILCKFLQAGKSAMLQKVEPVITKMPCRGIYRGDGPIHDFSDSVTRNDLMEVYVRVEFLDEMSAILDTLANRGPSQILSHVTCIQVSGALLNHEKAWRVRMV